MYRCGDFYYGDYPFVSQWEAQRVLYRNQKRSTAQQAGNWNAQMQQFFQYQSQQNTPLHILGELEDGLTDLYPFSPVAVAEQDDFFQFSEQLYQLDSTFMSDGGDSLAYLADRADLIDAIGGAYLNGIPLLETLRQDRQSLVQTLTAANADITTSHVAADHQKTVNELYLATIGAGQSTLSPAREQQLRSIAELCPYRAGHAVYRAQSVLRHYECDFTADDCGNQQALQGVPPTEIEPPSLDRRSEMIEEVTVYPNPSNGYLTVDLPLSSGQWEVRLIDLQGRTLRTLEMPNGRSNLDFSDRASGVYWLSFRANETSLTKRIILQ